MPEDLLEVETDSRVFYDNLRRLITIEMFLENKNVNPNKINNELKKILGKSMFAYIKNNEEVNNKIIKEFRNIIKNKLNKIRKLLNGQN